MIIKTNADIIKDPNPILDKRLKEIELPLTDELKETLSSMRQYVINSMKEEYYENFDITPSVGMALNQVGIDGRAFVVYITDEEGDIICDEIFINPKIVSESVQKTYLEGGEGCLSVGNKVDGFVYRSHKIKVEYFNLEEEKITKEFIGYPAICIQHEYDHLNGMLYYQRIDKVNPFIEKDNSIKI